MSALVGFFTGLADLLRSVIDFFVGLVGDIVYIATLIAKAVAAIPSYFTWLPAPLLSLLLVIFAVVALYKILGRE